MEYETLKNPLFKDMLIGSNERGGVERGSQSVDGFILERLHLQEYITLRSVLDLSCSNISFSSGYFIAGELV